MLHIHTNNTTSTTEVFVRNRLCYLLILDSVSQEETHRLWKEFDKTLELVCEEETKREIVKTSIHYLWWEKSMVGAIFLTSDIFPLLEGENPIPLKELITKAEEEEIKIPYCRMYYDIFENLASGGGNTTSSRIVTKLDDENAAVQVFVNGGDSILSCGFKRRED